MITDYELQEAFPFGFLLVDTDEESDFDAVRMGVAETGGNDVSWHAITEFDADTYFTRDVREVNGKMTLDAGGYVFALVPLPESAKFQNWTERESR